MRPVSPVPGQKKVAAVAEGSLLLEVTPMAAPLEKASGAQTSALGVPSVQA